MIECNPDRCSIAGAVGVLSRRLTLGQNFDAAQVLTGPALVVGDPTRPEANCSILNMAG